MEDRAIVELFWARNQQAITASRDKYGGYCRTIALRLLGDLRDAEECERDDYLRAWNAIPPKRPEHLGTFLGKITRNLAIDRLRAAGAGKRAGERYTQTLEELGPVLSGGGDPAEAVEAAELAETLDAFLGSLPRQERRVFIRRYYHLCTIPEIASQYGCSVSKTKAMLHRTRKKLRGYLMERGYLT